jgi:hypothetical protein
MLFICVNYSLFKSVCSNHLYRSKFVLTIEGVDSNNKDKVGAADSDVTPISKSLDDIDVGGCEASSTKEPKLVSASKVAAVAPVVTPNTPNSLGKRAAESVVPVVDVDVA